MAGGGSRWRRERLRPHRRQGGLGLHAREPHPLDAWTRSSARSDEVRLDVQLRLGGAGRAAPPRAASLGLGRDGGGDRLDPTVVGEMEQRPLDAHSGFGGGRFDARGGGPGDASVVDGGDGLNLFADVDSVQVDATESAGWPTGGGVGVDLHCLSWGDRLEQLERREVYEAVKFAQYSEYSAEFESIPDSVEGREGWPNSSIDVVQEIEAQGLLAMQVNDKVDSDAETDDGSSPNDELSTYELKVQSSDQRDSCLHDFLCEWQLQLPLGAHHMLHSSLARHLHLPLLVASLDPLPPPWLMLWFI